MAVAYKNGFLFVQARRLYLCRAIIELVILIFPMTDSNSALKKQLPKNAICSALNFGVYSLSAAFLTPYLLKTLGPAAFGLVSIAAIFTQWIAIITSQISAAVNRFLTIELQKPDGNPNTVFNSAFALYIVLVLVQIPILGGGLLLADKLFSIPAELKVDALLLLGCSGASFLLAQVGGVFSVSLFSKNRLDIGYLLMAGSLIARFCLIVALFLVFEPQLRFIGYVDLGLQIFFLGVAIKIWRIITPELNFSYRAIDWKLLKPVFAMSSWTLLNRLGSLLYLRSDIWIINKFISEVAAGQYAAILVIANFVRQLGNQFSNQLAPSIMNYWAKEDMVSLRRLLVFMVKVLAFAMAVPVAYICANGHHILGLWLGDDFSQFSFLLLILCIHLPVNLSVLPLFTLNTASNSVKLPAMLTFALGVVNVLASYWLGVTLGMGAIGVAVATAVVLSLKNTLFVPVYASYIMKLSWFKLLGYTLSGVLVTGVIYLISNLPIAALVGLSLDTYPGIVLQGIFVVIMASILGWWLVLHKDEKRVLIDMIPARIRMALHLSA